MGPWRLMRACPFDALATSIEIISRRGDPSPYLETAGKESDVSLPRKNSVLSACPVPVHTIDEIKSRLSAATPRIWNSTRLATSLPRHQVASICRTSGVRLIISKVVKTSAAKTSSSENPASSVILCANFFIGDAFKSDGISAERAPRRRFNDNGHPDWLPLWLPRRGHGR